MNKDKERQVMNKDNYSVQAEHLVGRSEVRVDAFDKVTGRHQIRRGPYAGRRAVCAHKALHHRPRLRKEYQEYLLCGENTRPS